MKGNSFLNTDLTINTPVSIEACLPPSWQNFKELLLCANGTLKTTQDTHVRNAIAAPDVQQREY